jgi:hypothetical protein
MGSQPRRVIHTTCLIHALDLASLHSGVFDCGVSGSLGDPCDFGDFQPSGRTVDCTGMDNHQVADLPIGTGLTIAKSQHGEVILIVHQLAMMHGNCQTTFSCIQFEDHGCRIYDKAPAFSDSSFVPHLAVAGYVFPFEICNGLAYLTLRPPTTHDLLSLPRVQVTSAQEWNPNKHDFAWHRASWSAEDVCLLHSVPFDYDGNILPSAAAADYRASRSIDRTGIRAFLTAIAKSKYQAHLSYPGLPTLINGLTTSSQPLRRSKRLQSCRRAPSPRSGSPPSFGEQSRLPGPKRSNEGAKPRATGTQKTGESSHGMGPGPSGTTTRQKTGENSHGTGPGPPPRGTPSKGTPVVEKEDVAASKPHTVSGDDEPPPLVRPQLTDEEDCDSDDESAVQPANPQATATVETVNYDSDTDSDSVPPDLIGRPVIDESDTDSDSTLSHLTCWINLMMTAPWEAMTAVMKTTRTCGIWKTAMVTQYPLPTTMQPSRPHSLSPFLLKPEC